MTPTWIEGPLKNYRSPLIWLCKLENGRITLLWNIVTYRYTNPLDVTSPQTAILNSPAAPAPCFQWTTMVSLLTVMGCCCLMYSPRPKRTALTLTASVTSLISGLKVRRKCIAPLKNVSSITVFITSIWSRGYRQLVCNKLSFYPNWTQCWIID